MNCALYEWVAEQTDIDAHLQGTLLRLTKLMDADGCIAMGQAEIAQRIKMSERQTRTNIKELVAAKLLIRRRRGSVGGGRASDMLIAGIAKIDNRASLPLSRDNGDNLDFVPVSPESTNQPVDNGSIQPVSNSVAHIEHAPARADSNLINTTTSEIYPETLELRVGDGGAFELAPPVASKPDKRGTRMRADWAPGPSAMAEAVKLGIVNGWGEATLANFIDYWLGVPGARGLKLDWDATYRNELRKESKARRHIPTTYTSGRGQHVNAASRANFGPDYGRGKSNHHSDELLRDILGDPPDGDGRVDIFTGK